jgi:hypothetical protein
MGLLPHLILFGVQVLIADFFFVCLSLVALIVAIIVQAVSKSTVRGRLSGGTPVWLLHASGAFCKGSDCNADIPRLTHCCNGLQILSGLWLAAWPIIFQPAIGILMGGAVRFSMLKWSDPLFCFLLQAMNMLAVWLRRACSAMQLLSGLIGWVQSDIIKD